MPSLIPRDLSSGKVIKNQWRNLGIAKIFNWLTAVSGRSSCLLDLLEGNDAATKMKNAPAGIHRIKNHWRYSHFGNVSDRHTNMPLNISIWKTKTTALKKEPCSCDATSGDWKQWWKYTRIHFREEKDDPEVNCTTGEAGLLCSNNSTLNLLYCAWLCVMLLFMDQLFSFAYSKKTLYGSTKKTTKNPCC